MMAAEQGDNLPTDRFGTEQKHITESITEQLATLYSNYEARQAELDKKVIELENKRITIEAEINQMMKDAEAEIAKRAATHTAAMKQWEDEQALIAKTQNIGSRVKINGAFATSPYPRRCRALCHTSYAPLHLQSVGRRSQPLA